MPPDLSGLRSEKKNDGEGTFFGSVRGCSAMSIPTAIQGIVACLNFAVER